MYKIKRPISLNVGVFGYIGRMKCALSFLVLVLVFGLTSSVSELVFACGRDCGSCPAACGSKARKRASVQESILSRLLVPLSEINDDGWVVHRDTEDSVMRVQNRFSVRETSIWPSFTKPRRCRKLFNEAPFQVLVDFSIPKSNSTSEIVFRIRVPGGKERAHWVIKKMIDRSTTDMPKLKGVNAAHGLDPSLGVPSDRVYSLLESEGVRSATLIDRPRLGETDVTFRLYIPTSETHWVELANFFSRSLFDQYVSVQPDKELAGLLIRAKRHRDLEHSLIATDG